MYISVYKTIYLYTYIYINLLVPGLQCKAKDFYMVTIPIRDRMSENPAATTTMRVPLILPHELLHFLSVVWQL